MPGGDSRSPSACSYGTDFDTDACREKWNLPRRRSRSRSLTREDIDEIINSDFQTDYTYGDSISYRKNGSFDYIHPRMHRPRIRFGYNGGVDFNNSKFDYQSSPRKIYRWGEARPSILKRAGSWIAWLLRSLIKSVVFVGVFVYYLARKSLRYVSRVLLPWVFGPYYAAKAYLGTGKRTYQAVRFAHEEGYLQRIWNSLLGALKTVGKLVVYAVTMGKVDYVSKPEWDISNVSPIGHATKKTVHPSELSPALHSSTPKTTAAQPTHHYDIRSIAKDAEPTESVWQKVKNNVKLVFDVAVLVLYSAFGWTLGRFVVQEGKLRKRGRPRLSEKKPISKWDSVKNTGAHLWTSAKSVAPNVWNAILALILAGYAALKGGIGRVTAGAFASGDAKSRRGRHSPNRSRSPVKTRRQASIERQASVEPASPVYKFLTAYFWLYYGGLAWDLLKKVVYGTETEPSLVKRSSQKVQGFLAKQDKKSWWKWLLLLLLLLAFAFYAYDNKVNKKRSLQTAIVRDSRLIRSTIYNALPHVPKTEALATLAYQVIAPVANAYNATVESAKFVGDYVYRKTSTGLQSTKSTFYDIGSSVYSLGGSVSGSTSSWGSKVSHSVYGFWTATYSTLSKIVNGAASSVKKAGNGIVHVFFYTTDAIYNAHLYGYQFLKHILVAAKESTTKKSAALYESVSKTAYKASDQMASMMDVEYIKKAPSIDLSAVVWKPIKFCTDSAIVALNWLTSTSQAIAQSVAHFFTTIYNFLVWYLEKTGYWLRQLLYAIINTVTYLVSQTAYYITVPFVALKSATSNMSFTLPKVPELPAIPKVDLKSLGAKVIPGMPAVSEWHVNWPAVPNVKLPQINARQYFDAASLQAYNTYSTIASYCNSVGSYVYNTIAVFNKTVFFLVNELLLAVGALFANLLYALTWLLKAPFVFVWDVFTLLSAFVVRDTSAKPVVTATDDELDARIRAIVISLLKTEHQSLDDEFSAKLVVELNKLKSQFASDNQNLKQELDHNLRNFLPKHVDELRTFMAGLSSDLKREILEQVQNEIQVQHSTQVHVIHNDIEKLKTELRSNLKEVEGDVHLKLTNIVNVLNSNQDKRFDEYADKLEKKVVVVQNEATQKSLSDLAHLQKEVDEFKVIAQKSSGSVDQAKVLLILNELLQKERNAIKLELKALETKLAHQKSAVNVEQELDKRFEVLLASVLTRINGQNAQISDELNQIRKDHMKTLERSANGAHVTAGQINWNDPAALDRIRLLIKQAIDLYDADKTGQPDFALEPSGGSIIGIGCTKQYQEVSRLQSIFGFGTHHVQYGPRTVIQRRANGATAGECWCYEGGHGQLKIKLAKRIKVTAVAYEHVRASLSPGGHIHTAPKDFKVWAYANETAHEKHLLGSFVYQEKGDALQTFAIQYPTKDYVNVVELETETNYGAGVTCLYRFRVHGDPDPETKPEVWEGNK